MDIESIKAELRLRTKKELIAEWSNHKPFMEFPHELRMMSDGTPHNLSKEMIVGLIAHAIQREGR